MYIYLNFRTIQLEKQLKIKHELENYQFEYGFNVVCGENHYKVCFVPGRR